MLTDVATKILRRTDSRFAFRGGSRMFEIGVWFEGQHVGFLEHNEMTDHDVHATEVLGAYGLPWSDDQKKLGRRPYHRGSWQRCFNLILGSVPREVAARGKELLRKAGYKLC